MDKQVVESEPSFARILNNSKRYSVAKRAAKAAWQAERIERGWIHPKDRQPRPRGDTYDFVREMFRISQSFGTAKKGIKIKR